ncbi:MAG: hypothetical protein JWQ84_3548 [Mucilaginibacter sp.]|nr:hypothetical protein [Mucilaginibacter sp.]
MVREIIIPDKNKVSVVLPDDYIGKTIEVIAFVLDESVTKNEIFSPTFNALKIDTLNYPFNREETCGMDK